MKVIDSISRLLFKDAEHTENILIAIIWSFIISDFLTGRDQIKGWIMLGTITLFAFVYIFDYEVEEETEELGAMPDREDMEKLEVEVLE